MWFGGREGWVFIFLGRKHSCRGHFTARLLKHEGRAPHLHELLPGPGTIISDVLTGAEAVCLLSK